MTALRRDINTKEVTFNNFQKAMERVAPSITPDMENWYKRFMKQIGRVERPAPLVV
jgi:SpoVK/Ycf46/Vps4 family AAA+-type ATPase